MITEDYAKNRLGLNDSEYDKLKSWYIGLITKRKSNYFGAIGGELVFHINPTSIGEIITVSCGKHSLVLRDL